jgi:hypothetical protein
MKATQLRLVVVDDHGWHPIHVEVDRKTKYAQLERRRDEQNCHHPLVTHGVPKLLQRNSKQLYEPAG